MRRTLLLAATLSLLLPCLSAEAGHVNSLFRYLGLGWSDGYHSQGRGSWQAKGHPARRPSAFTLGPTSLGPLESPAPERVSPPLAPKPTEDEVLPPNKQPSTGRLPSSRRSNRIVRPSQQVAPLPPVRPEPSNYRSANRYPRDY